MIKMRAGVRAFAGYGHVGIRLNPQARLLPCFADGSLSRAFMHIHPAARQTPASTIGPPQQQNLPRLVQHRGVRTQFGRNDPNFGPEQLQNAVAIELQGFRIGVRGHIEQPVIPVDVVWILGEAEPFERNRLEPVERGQK